MRLYLINPCNPVVSIIKVKENRWNRYRVWKPLSLMVLAGLTPDDWEVSILDENIGIPDYLSMPLPDLVGITAFTSQANRAYEVSTYFRQLGVPVVMGGIHASVCLKEVSDRVDSIVTGEAEGVWQEVLEDIKRGTLKKRYKGGLSKTSDIPAARHDLLPERYAFGAIQTTRGCPLNCSFCSVTAFNGSRYRMRPIADIIQEFKLIKEKRVLVVDDNLTGTRPDHITRTKELFHAMIEAKLKKKWITQVTINFADDDELLMLAFKAGCRGVFIGFESPTPEGLKEICKKFNIQNGRNFRTSVKRIQKHGILVVGSFIIGLDVDKSGIGKRIAQTAIHYGLDNVNSLFLTPLPGTRLWEQMKKQGRIALNRFPEDWKYYTLTYPVAIYKNLSLESVIKEMISCSRTFYSIFRILRRFWSSFWGGRNSLISLVGNLSYRKNINLSNKSYMTFLKDQITRYE